MLFDRPDPAEVPYTEAELDLRERWLPSAEAVEAALAELAGMPACTIAVLALAQPGKRRGLWTTGQEVVTVPWMATAREGDHGPERQAAEDAAHGWLKYHRRSGTVSYVLVYPDGHAAVFEGF